MDRLFLLRFNFRICGVIHGRLSLVFVLFFSMGSVFRGLEQHSKLGGGLPTFQFSSRLVTFSCSPSLLKRNFQVSEHQSLYVMHAYPFQIFTELVSTQRCKQVYSVPDFHPQ